MRQIVQDIRNGELRFLSAPDPVASQGQVVIANAASVVSAGTEKMARDLANRSLLAKARERPDHVRRVIEKARQEGLFRTYQQVQRKLGERVPLGYSSAGVVLACGDRVESLRPGDRVASNGPHANLVAVPHRLCAKVPDSVPLDQAALAVIGAIALQGVRLAGVGLNDTTFVIGLGLVGQITVALLRACGCRVMATDLDPSRCEIALAMGAELAKPHMQPESIDTLTSGLGTDAVLVTAASSSNEPIELAAATVRKRGKVVAVGAIGLELPRRPFYFKEAELVVSCSYGPGRYDPFYEEQGHDYPAPYVRWTEQRNIQAVLDLMARGALDVSPLISHRFPFERAHEAYDLIEEESEPYLGIVFEYPAVDEYEPEHRVELQSRRFKREGIGVGLIGAGSFASSTLVPALMKARPEVRLVTLCSGGGLSAAEKGERLGFEAAVSSDDELVSDPNVDAVFVATRHHLHADQVTRALRADKHVFVEKPLALTVGELAKIEETLVEAATARPVLMVGFNRRFSPAVQKVKDHFREIGSPVTVSIRFNAGSIPPDHWTQVEEIGGGRIIGEACHAIDLATYLIGAPPVKVYAESISGPKAPAITDDQSFITLRHSDGSISNIAYVAGGDRSLPKERIEVLGGGRMAIIDDFRSVTLAANGRRKVEKSLQQDKGHRAEVQAFLEAIKSGGPDPIPWEELKSVSLAAILAVQSLHEGAPLWIAKASHETDD